MLKPRLRVLTVSQAASVAHLAPRVRAVGTRMPTLDRFVCLALEGLRAPPLQGTLLRAISLSLPSQVAHPVRTAMLDISVHKTRCLCLHPAILVNTHQQVQRLA